MSTIAIVHHSGFGHTETIANAAAEGIRKAGSKAKLVKIENASEDFTNKLDSLNEARVAEITAQLLKARS